MLKAKTGEMQKPQVPGADTESLDTKATKTQMIDEINRLAEQNKALQAQIEKQAAGNEQAAMSRGARSSRNLPDAANIDQSVLRHPVMTKQGWLVPQNAFAAPNAGK